jgi:hypothetical protein
MDKMESLDADAVALVRAGDRDAFRPIVDRYSEMLFRLAYPALSKTNIRRK